MQCLFLSICTLHVLKAINDFAQMAFEDLQAKLLVAPSREELVPPPRFEHARFSSYIIDQQINGQSEAVSHIKEFAARSARRWYQWSRRHEKPGLYLDGDFGVGKTHLLASIFHEHNGSGTYCSFAEAISLAIIQGPEEAVNTLAADIVCIDEFELDDPSNTRLADLLVDGLVKRGCRIAVTSNTVPGELGAGRMSVEKFRDQLVRISNAFEDIHVPGQDYRQRERESANDNPPFWSPDVKAFDEPDAISIDMLQFDELLKEIPIINLRRLATQTPRLHLKNVKPCPDQLVALRLVHAIDKLYDYKSQVRVQANINLVDLFLPEYRDWAFAKKYRRCSSRLHELCSES